MQIVTERKTDKQKNGNAIIPFSFLWFVAFLLFLEKEAIENATFLIFAPCVGLPLFFGQNCCPRISKEQAPQ